MQELEADFWDGRWDMRVIDYARRMKSKYKLGIISDAYSGAREAVRVAGQVRTQSANLDICDAQTRSDFHKSEMLAMTQRRSTTIQLEHGIR